MIKILVTDDQELIRDSLKIILEVNPNFKVIATAKNGREVLAQCQIECPDIILMDVRMPIMDGTVCTKYVKQQYPHAKIIILTTFDDDTFIYSSLKYGASGYLLKGVSNKELYQAIETVNQDGAMINPEIAKKVFQLFSKMARSSYNIEVDETAAKHFSRGELRIIKQVGLGRANKEIAKKLFLSEGTVRNYISQILAKLNLRDRTQLALWSVQECIITQQLGDTDEA